MSPGKIASQAGHSFLGAALQAPPSTLGEYHKDFPTSPGTKVCLSAKNLAVIIKAQEAAQAAGIPHFLVVDSGHASFHGGEPVVTALGIGPARRSDVQHITKKFQLVP